MKRLFTTAILCILTLSLTSCLHSGFQELKVFDGTEITGIKEVQHRYKTDVVFPVSQQPQVKVVTMQVSDINIDKEKGEITFNVSDPTNIPDSEKGKVSDKQLAVIVNLASAAVCEPLSGVKFGIPGDWSKPNKFLVRAANGKTQEWTVKLNYNH